MRLVLFDIDDTLIWADSEVLWCHYLTREGLFDMSRIDKFEAAYRGGTLDFDEFMTFQLAPLAALEPQLLFSHRERFLEAEIRPRLCEVLGERVRAHREDGDRVLAVSAAHDFLAEPIAHMAGIDDGLYTTAERDGPGFTGRVAGQPCFQDGKVVRVEDWLAGAGTSWEGLQDSWFYSDSRNDLPLLRLVDHPVAVRPDDMLRQVATESNWEVIG
jgi:HAD superfamily hydrolase (TIGR01490 family)